ncbi:MAG: polysaccharide deacetylase family protein [Rhodoplanes sp.]
MRAGAIAAGLVAVALAGSLGLVFAQKGSLTALPWGKSAPEAASTGSKAAEPAAAQRSPRSVITPIADSVVVAQAGARGTGQTAASQMSAAAPALPSPSPAVAVQGPPCTNPNALGVTRVVEIDTTGGPGFGFEHFKQHDFLRKGEVVLTFDDGPWLNNTPAVLKALADQCVKATFFPIGKHATYYPEILKEVAEAGHTIGNHTWSHPRDISKFTTEEAVIDIEKGISAVRMAVGDYASPFIRFPSLKHPPELLKYVGEQRNMGVFSTDMDSFDFKARKPEQVVKNLIDKLEKHGKGILLMHDFQTVTAHAVPALLAQLREKGYKIVHMKAHDSLKSLAQYDEMVTKDQKGSNIGGGRPTSSVVKTVE